MPNAFTWPAWVDPELTETDRQLEHRSLELVAWYDGWGQACYGSAAKTFPRKLTTREMACWRDGHAEGLRDRQQALNGFGVTTDA